MPKERNALADLAEDLEEIVRGTRSDSYSTRIRKSARIIAELAKVPDCTFKGNPRVDKSADAVIACRAIAEEGAKE